jgi:hypothetical protein
MSRSSYVVRGSIRGFLRASRWACAASLLGCTALADGTTGSEPAAPDHPETLPICTIYSTGPCRQPRPPAVPIEYATATVTGDTSATLSFDTNLYPVTVTIVWAPLPGPSNVWTAPDDVASAEAVGGASWAVVAEPRGSDTFDISGLKPCAQYWYGLYAGGALQQSGSFQMTGSFKPLSDGKLVDVSVLPKEAAATITLTTSDAAWSGDLNVELTSTGSPPIELLPDGVSRGTTSRTIAGLAAGTHYNVSVSGCGVSATGSVDTLPAGTAQRTPWLVLACQPIDVSGGRPLSFFQDWLTSEGAGKAGMEDYFSDQSYGAVTLEGSVVKGWYVVPKTLAQVNAGANTTRAQRVTDCVAAAQAAGPFDMSSYFGIIAVYNAGVDWGYAGPGTLTYAGRTKSYPLVALSGGAYSDSAAAHEMGHGYGLSHAHDDIGNDYGDDWTIMGTGLRTYVGPFGDVPNCSVTTVPFGPCDAGPSMTAFERDTLGWLPPARKYTFGGSTAGEIVRLAPVNEPGKPGTLQLEIPASGGHYYSVDYKRRSGWDRNEVGDAVTVRDVVGGQSYLQTKQGTAGAFYVGDQFVDGTDRIRVTVLSIDENAAVVDVVAY